MATGGEGAVKFGSTIAELATSPTEFDESTFKDYSRDNGFQRGLALHTVRPTLV